MISPYKIRNLAIGCLPDFSETTLQQFRAESNYDMRDHGLAEILSCQNLTPESIPLDYHERLTQLSLHSRYQRYELMSCIPVGILLRTIRERYFVQEIKNLEDFYRHTYYTESIPEHHRTSKQRVGNGNE